MRSEEALSMSATDFANAGLDAKQYEKYKKAAILKWEKAQKNPADFFEWRVLHRRIADYWMPTMLANPSLGLIWARFFEHSEVLESHNNEIDEISLGEFALTWLFVPSRPFYLIAKKLASPSTYVDEVIVWYCFLNMWNEIIGSIITVLSILFSYIDPNFCRTQDVSIQFFLGTQFGLGQLPTIQSYLTKRFQNMIGAFLLALINYYVVWFIIPNFLSDFFFLALIYVILPLALIYVDTRTLVTLHRMYIMVQLIKYRMHKKFFKLNIK
jgi:hypothetical protein